jgi:prevent-host-death family protein
MTTTTMGAAEFKSKCLATLDEVAAGKRVVITKRGKPVAALTPMPRKSKSSAGSLAHLGKVTGDLVNFHDDWGPEDRD